MACPSAFNILRLRTEDLGPKLHARAALLDTMMNLVPREEWPIGAGVVRSSFEIPRSEPANVEQAWDAIQVLGSTFTQGCAKNMNDMQVGFLERQYRPEQFWLRGPIVCQADLTLNWNSIDFWNKYFMRMDQDNTKEITNRHLNVYGSYASKVYATSSGTVSYVAGVPSTQPPGRTLDLTGVSVPGCGLTQDLLDSQVHDLIMRGATSEDSGGWITNMGSGPVFPLMIGPDASNQIALNNPELREDIRQAFMGAGEGAMVLQRVGATRVIKNYRHVISFTPPRWSILGGTTLVRVNPWLNTTSSGEVTKGTAAIPNPDYLNPLIAQVEGAIVLNPMVMTEEVLRPVNAAPGMKWMAQDYYGEWSFVTGNDAFLGMDGCAGIADPLHELGRHFAQYKHAYKPVFPDFGIVFLFLRCPAQVDCLSCS